MTAYIYSESNHCNSKLNAMFILSNGLEFSLQ